MWVRSGLWLPNQWICAEENLGVWMNPKYILKDLRICQYFTVYEVLWPRSWFLQALDIIIEEFDNFLAGQPIDEVMSVLKEG